MERLRQRNQTHYDAHAVHVPSEHERRTGPAAPLKRFHNTVKRLLLQTLVPPGARVLDLGAGRGGDVRKWAECQVSFAKGLDISGAELDEARRRASALPGLTAVFERTDSLGVNAWDDPDGPYDVVTCMFALHYFFASERTCQTLLNHVARNLRKGGVFVGIVPDGIRINRALAHRSTSASVRLEAQWSGPPRPFGSPYLCEIEDTVTSQGGSLEYLVYDTVLTAVARQFGLQPILDLELPGLEATSTSFKHLVPPYPGPLAEATRLFAAFAFRKV